MVIVGPSALLLSELPEAASTTPARDSILVAGLGLFSSRGYHATSIRDIAGAAGLGSASLYSHFASKEEILAALVLIGHDVHHRALLSAVLASGPEPRSQMRALVTAHVRMHCQYPALARVATHERQHLSPTALAPAAALRRLSEDLIVEVVARGMQAGDFDIAHPEATLVALGSMGIAVATWFPERAHQMTPDEVATAYADLALRMVGAA